MLELICGDRWFIYAEREMGVGGGGSRLNFLIFAFFHPVRFVLFSGFCSVSFNIIVIGYSCL